MAQMKAAEAAVEILKKEGIRHAFGLPGAAINPFYDAMRDLGGIDHVLARHVEGASHMAEGFTGQAPVARLHKEDFQAVDIATVAKTLTKMAMTVLEPAQVPGAFQQAFHLMRSGRPGPVLIDLPFDVQMTEIDFDPDTYQPLPVYKPTATRAQVERAMDLLAEAERPLIVAGGGIVNADAADLLVQFAELTGIPVIPTLMGVGLHPRNRQPLGQPAHRRAGDVPPWPAVRARRHRAHPDRPGLRARLRHRLRRRRRTRALLPGSPGT